MLLIRPHYLSLVCPVYMNLTGSMGSICRKFNRRQLIDLGKEVPIKLFVFLAMKVSLRETLY